MPIVLGVLTIIYGASAAWSLSWQSLENSADKPYFLPATVLAVLGIPIAIGLFTRRRAGYVALWVHAGVWLAVGLAIAHFVKEHTTDLYFAVGHVVLAALPFAHPRVRQLFFGGPVVRAALRREINLQSFVDVEGKSRQGDTLDLSREGAFVAVPTDGLSVGQRVTVQMHLRANKFLRLPAHIVTITTQDAEGTKRGIGVRWAHPTDHDLTNLDHFKGEGVRQSELITPLKLTASFQYGAQTHTCDLYALTTTGCYLDDKEQVLQPGEKVTLNINLHEGDTIDVLCEVMWLAGDATIVAVTKVRGSALEFRGLSKKDAQRIETRISQGDGASS